MIRAAVEAGLVRQVVPLIDQAPDHVRGRVIEAIEGAGTEMAHVFLGAFGAPGQAAELAPVIPPDIMAAIRKAAQAHGLSAELDASLTS